MAKEAYKPEPEPGEVPASDVKNFWHEYVARVSQAREVIVVTRYGKPVMKMAPIDDTEDEQGIFGFLSDTVAIHGDIVAPTGERWDAEA